MLIRGDARAIPLRDGSVHCVVTSPPYHGLRNYRIGDAGIGLEPTVAEHVAALVAVFRELRRVLRDDGLVWCNYGDAYGPDGNLLGLAWRLAFALQADGWWLRAGIVWAKGVSFRPEWSGSVMPESVQGTRWERCRVKQAKGRVARHGQEGIAASGEPRAGSREDGAEWSPCPGCPKCAENDGLVLRRGSWRPTTAHEYVFMLAKSPRYYADGIAVQETSTLPERDILRARVTGRGEQGFSDARGNDRDKSGGFPVGGTRNPRSVWAIGTAPFKEAHFATFPEKLVEPMILASTCRQNCPKCGAPWARVVERGALKPDEPGYKPRGNLSPDGYVAVGMTIAGSSQPAPNHHYESRTLGFRATCPCPGNDGTGQAVVLDPFSGSGTVVRVAVAHGRRGIGLDLAPHYHKIATRRNREVPVRLPL